MFMGCHFDCLKKPFQYHGDGSKCETQLQAARASGQHVSGHHVEYIVQENVDKGYQYTSSARATTHNPQLLQKHLTSKII
jgi:hypothetical protein